MTLAPDITVQQVLNAIGFNWERDYDKALTESEFPAGSRIALMSPPNDGKTTTVAGLFMRANGKVGDTLHTDSKFKCRMLERGSSVHQDVSDLSNGIFPAKTQTYLGFRSSPGLLLEQFRHIGLSIPLTGRIFGRNNLRPAPKLWHKALQISINDLPGETLNQVMWQYRLKTGPQQKVIADMIGNAITEMRNCQAYIFILNAALAHGLGLPIESERDPNVSRDPDVNLVRMLEDIANYKAKHSQQIKAAYVVITQWDKLEPRASQIGFDLFDTNLVRRQSDLEEFVRHCFPQFFGALHSSGVKLVNYYPTFFQTEKNKDGTEIFHEDQLEYYDVNGQLGIKTVRRPHIMTKDLMDPEAKSIWENVRKISCSEQSFDTLLNDIMQLAVNVR